MRPPIALLKAAAFTILLGACDRPHEVLMSSPHPNTIRLPASDRTFRLTAQERASVRSGFDIDALERFLAAMVPEARASLFAAFQFAAPGEGTRNLIKMEDPALQRLLDEVWVPFWASSPASLRNPHYSADEWPGLGLARRRAGIPLKP